MLKILGIGDWGLGIGDWGFGGLGKNPKPNNTKPKTKKQTTKKNLNNLKKIKI